MPIFDTPTPIEVEITTGAGQVVIIASDRTDTVVEVVGHNPRRAGDAALAKDATVRFAEGRLTVAVPKRISLFGPGDSADVRVELPTGSRVEVTNGYGDVRARGTLGRSRIIAAYGTVSLEQTGDLTLKSPHGNTDIERVAGDLDLIAGHGQLRIGSVSGAANIRGSHGDIQLGSVEGDLEARTAGGFTVRHAGGGLTVRSAYGAIRIGEVSSGSVLLENAHAELQVGVPEGMAAWIDASSQHGVVRNELTPTGGPDDAPTVELRLRNNWGDIIIERSTRQGSVRAGAGR